MEPVTVEAREVHTAHGRHCFKAANGTDVCVKKEDSQHNLTDIHREGGVDDFHNDHGKDSHEHAAGIVPHNGNVGNVVFEYSKNNDSSGFRDDHKEAGIHDDHHEETKGSSSDWASKSNTGNRTHHNNEDLKSVIDVQIYDNTTTTITESYDNEDESGSLESSQTNVTFHDIDNDKYLHDEYKDGSVYDLHEESSSSDSTNWHVDSTQLLAEVMREHDSNKLDREVKQLIWSSAMPTMMPRDTDARQTGSSRPQFVTLDGMLVPINFDHGPEPTPVWSKFDDNDSESDQLSVWAKATMPPQVSAAATTLETVTRSGGAAGVTSVAPTLAVRSNIIHHGHPFGDPWLPILASSLVVVLVGLAIYNLLLISKIKAMRRDRS